MNEKHEHVLTSLLRLIELNGSIAIDQILEKEPLFLQNTTNATKLYLISEMIKKRNPNMIHVFCKHQSSKALDDFFKVSHGQSLLKMALNEVLDLRPENKKRESTIEVFKVLCEKNLKFKESEWFQINHYLLLTQDENLEDCLNYYKLIQEKKTLENKLNHESSNTQIKKVKL